MDSVPQNGSPFTALPKGPKGEPAFAILARALGHSPSGTGLLIARGLVYSFHAWGQERNLPDGCLRGYDEERLAIALDFEGDPDQLVTGLVKAGFAEERDGCLWITDFKEFGGRQIESRKRETERKRLQRAGSPSKSPPPQHRTVHPDRDIPSQGYPDMSLNVPGASQDNQRHEGGVPPLEQNDVHVVRETESLREMRRNDGARDRANGSITVLRAIDEMAPGERAQLDQDQQELATELEADAAYEAAQRESARQAALRAAGGGVSVWDRHPPEAYADWGKVAEKAGLMPNRLPPRPSAYAPAHQVAEAVTA